MVRKRFQQILSWYLVLSLALAGAIAFSPVLHRAIEHQGVGPLHTHAHSHQGFQAESAPLAHEHARDSGFHHPHVHDHAHEAGHRYAHGLFTHSHHQFVPPDLNWKGLWQAICHYFSDHDGRPFRESPPDSEEGHSHHSLPELLAAGLVDVAVDIDPLLIVPELLRPHSDAASEPLPSSCWNAQTPTRGPPAVAI